MLLIYEDRQQTRRLERLDELPQPFHGIAAQRQAVAGGRTPAQARRSLAFARRRDAEADGRPVVMYLRPRSLCSALSLLDSRFSSWMPWDLRP